jgi:hypothetical protein
VDITDVRRTEEVLQARRWSRRPPAGGIAHDFNNLPRHPGYASRAPGPRSRSSVAEDVKEIRAAGQSAESLTRQLLAFSRRQILQPQTLDLNSLLHAWTRCCSASARTSS